jgi:broad specificity phosphatase PhoE
MRTPHGPDLLLIRHGETTWSKSGQHTGRTDLPLTEKGIEQAKALVPRLADAHFALVMTSPRIRAVTTAALAGLEGAVVDPDLAEWDYGDFEGLTTPQIQQQIPGWSIWAGPWPNGETLDQVATRADRVVERIRGAAGAGESVAVVAHGHLIRVLAARWLAAPADTGRWFALGTASVSKLGWERTTAVIEHWNDDSHLDASR